jgi:hypothetical protein
MPAIATSTVPRVPVSYEVALAQETDESILIAADAEVTIPILIGIVCLLGFLYSAKYLLVPLLKLIKVPGTNWFSDAVNFVLGAITKPIEDYAKTIYAWIATGVNAHLRPVTNFLESLAWVAHDAAIVTATTFAQVATTLHSLRYEIIPREINRATQPLRNSIRKLNADIAAYNAIARANGFINFRTMLKVETPRITELRKAEAYVKQQGHVSLAGALSTYQATTNTVKTYEETVRHLHFDNMPTWIRVMTKTVTQTIPKTIKQLALKVGKIEHLVTPNRFGIPTLMALMAPAAIARWFRPAIPNVCTEVGECAASNLLGKSNWQWFKDLLALLLLPTIDALALADLCAIANLAQDTARAFEPELRGLAVVAGGLSSIGCASPGITMGEPLY